MKKKAPLPARGNQNHDQLIERCMFYLWAATMALSTQNSLSALGQYCQGPQIVQTVGYVVTEMIPLLHDDPCSLPEVSRL